MGHDREMPEPDKGPDQGRVADAPEGNWVDRHAPARLRPYLRLSRADRPIGTWLLLIPCWWGLALAIAHDGQARLADLWIALACAVGAFLMRGAGCTWNDITDREIDAQVARTASRPIPSGQIGVRRALVWLVVQVAISALILFSFNRGAIIAGIIALLPVAIYPFAKRFTWWPQLFLGVAFNWGALLGWIAHTGSLHPAALALYGAGILWTLFYDTIYAHQDTEDDALIGVRSTALLFGERTGVWLRRFMVGAVVLMTLAVVMALAPTGDALALVVALGGPWFFGWHLFWQALRLDIHNPVICLRLFRSNRDAGLIVVLFFAISAVL